MGWIEAGTGAKMLCSLGGSDVFSSVYCPYCPFAETVSSVAAETARAAIQIVELDCRDIVLSSVDWGLLLERLYLSGEGA